MNLIFVFIIYKSVVRIIIDLYIRSITGQEEMLTSHEVSRKDVVNGDKYIDVTVIKTENNTAAYQLIRNQNFFIYDDEEYIIKGFKENMLGDTVIANCKAFHRAFDDLNSNHIYEQITGIFPLGSLLTFSLKGTGYTPVIINTIDMPVSVKVENFGDDNSLALLKSTLNKFGAEFEIIGKNIEVSKEIGSYTDEQFRYFFNIKNPSKEIDTTTFFTYIKGFGKKNEDGSYVVTADYKSPLADVYGVKHAKPVRDERYTDYNELLDRIKRELNDSIDITVNLTAVEAEKLGWQYINKGDYVWCIIDPFDMDVRIRVVEVQDFSNENKPKVYTLGKLTKKPSDILANFTVAENQLKQLIDDGGNLSLLQKKLYANTYMYTDNSGMWMIDPNNPYRYAHHGSGGSDYRRGMIRIEREDGYAVIIDGVLQHGFDIGGAEPPFLEVGQEGYWWMTAQTELRSCNYYTFQHKSRYLNVLIAQYVEEGTTCETAIVDGDGKTLLKKLVSTNTSIGADEAKYGRLIEIDLGVPTGEAKSVYIQMRSTVDGKKAYCRKLRMWIDR
ncbi:phage tail protein [Bacillus thuringiensis]|uniref:phage tail protein n=1 Tax=Bacillus thuringiensis TaxID=1428 RepID=UPI003339CD88